MKNSVRFIMTILVSLSLFSPLANVVYAQPGSDLIANLKNRPKLQVQASKFESSLAKLKSLAAKSTFTDADLAAIDSFIYEKDDSLPIVVRAQSKAFANAQKVQAFEDGVKAAAKGKDPAAFIKALEDNPKDVMKIPGADAAAQAFSKSLDADAAVLKNLSAKLKADASRKASINFLNENVQFTTAGFSLFNSEKENDLLTNDYVEPKSMAIPGAVEAALIALAVAYLGVQTYRLTSGAIGRCVDRAMETHQQCIRDERRDGGRLTRSERLLCRAEYLADVAICVVLPI